MPCSSMLCECCQKIVKAYQSTIGKKIIMAITGLMMIGFVISHMLGNLKVFAGFNSLGIAELDIYAIHLQEFGMPLLGHKQFLWIARIGLLGAVILHVITAIQLAALNRESRPLAYQVQKYSSSTIAARMMTIGGLFLLCFIIFHILHFTTGHAHIHGFVEGRVYANVYSAFQHGPLVSIYVVAMVFLLLHLLHGTWSVFQTLGINSTGWNETIRRLAVIVAFGVSVGFVTVPIAMYAGVLPPPSDKFVEEHK